MNEEVDKAIREAMARYPEKAKSYSETFLKSNMILNVAQEVSKLVDERDRQLDERDRQQNWHLAVQDAIRDLLELKDDKKKWFFDKQGYWHAIHVVLMDEGFIPKDIKDVQFISDYCSSDTSPHYILPRDNDQLGNPYRIGALNNEGNTVNTANEMGKARRKEKDKKSGNEKFPNVDLFKEKFRELLVKHGAIKP